MKGPDVRALRPFGVRLWCAFLILSGPPLSAQYALRSPYLQHPESVIGYVDSCARFWMQAYDSVNGGYAIGIDRTGKVIPGWGTNKNVLIQSRDAYGFVRAFMLTGNELYLKSARRALDFMYAHCWDTTNAGWFDSNDQKGNPTGSTTKTAFDQHYAILGPLVCFEATRDSLDWLWVLKGYESSERSLWDAHSASYGYFDQASADWSAQTAKSFTATVDAITTHVLELCLLTQDETYRTRLLQLTQNVLDHFVGTMRSQAIGFVEAYNSDWSWDNTTANYNTRTIMGHVLKAAWCLGRVHQLFPDSAYIGAAESLASNVLVRGYDHAFGGPYKDYDRVSGQMISYGQDTAKAWWQMEEAVTSGLMLYEITGKASYLQMADESLDFFMNYFVDHQYGEVYADRTRRGGPIPAWGDNKGSDSKGGYHSTELGYYVYLYGKLFLAHEPATLHYMLPSQGAERSVTLSPVAFASGYRLKEVLLNGATYTDFNAPARTLHLPSGVGGHFTVTFESAAAAVRASPVAAACEFHLEQNYPNPFNPQTTIEYTLSSAEHVRLSVYDLLGRQVSTIVDALQASGTYRVRWNASGCSSGMYFYRLSDGTRVQTKSMLLVR